MLVKPFYTLLLSVEAQLRVVAEVRRRWETVRTNSRGTRGASNGDDSPSLYPLRKRGEGSAMGMPRARKQNSRCHACGRRSRENPTPNAYPEACREEILHASQERSSLQGLTRTSGVSRITV